MEKKRQSNIELLRIIAMFSIIAHHYVVNSGINNCLIENPCSVRTAILIVFGAWGKTSINIFVLITGYFMCQSKLTVKKYLKLIGEFVFYNLILFLIYWRLGCIDFSWSGLLQKCNPIYMVGNSFVPAYFLLLLFVPFLNRFIEIMDQKTHAKLVVLLLGVYSGLGSLSFILFTFNYLSWFVILYILSAYIRKYPNRLLFSGRFVGIKLIGALVIASATLVYEIRHLQHTFFWVSDSNKILALLISVYVFVFFLNINVSYNSIINLFASTTLGVLLIHADSSIMRSYIWDTVYPNSVYYYTKYVYLHAFAKVFLVFVICAIIDIIRIYTVEKLWLKAVDWIITRVGERNNIRNKATPKS
ncbi:Surface polysaccharide O-acyltransferase, integral membrane enzyme [Oscillospiraceae bacterium]|nr:Surface polysaccharide O-acyltransferase, integral membrane enzyme [Oscillospiraceae bacterium]